MTRSGSSTESGISDPVVLVRDAGLPFDARLEGDPIAAWMELMELVEALCPQWPERPLRVGHDYRL